MRDLIKAALADFFRGSYDLDENTGEFWCPDSNNVYDTDQMADYVMARLEQNKDRT